MFFLASKAFFFLITPSAWILGFLLLAVFVKRTKLKRVFLFLGVGLFILFSNVALCNAVLSLWEEPSKPARSVTGKYEYAVVLGGMVSQNKETKALHMSQSIDRLLEAIILYKRGNVQKIVITGGSGTVFSQEEKESFIIKDFCIDMGIDSANLILEPNSRNTHENALFTKKLIGTGSKVLLFTSAFHMKRSKGCFKREGFLFDTFSTDPLQTATLGPDDYFLPKLEPLTKWPLLIKEWVGYIAYKLAGYI